MLFLVSYDLNNPGKNYDALYQKIKQYGAWCHPCDSTWFIVAESSAEAIRDNLFSVMDRSDVLIVTKASAPGAWQGLSQDTANWLRQNL